jgi:hypothetical protein
MALLFGGVYADEVFADLWQFNLYTNMWIKFQADFGDEPEAVKAHTIVAYSEVEILYELLDLL